MNNPSEMLRSARRFASLCDFEKAIAYYVSYQKLSMLNTDHVDNELRQCREVLCLLDSMSAMVISERSSTVKAPYIPNPSKPVIVARAKVDCGSSKESEKLKTSDKVSGKSGILADIIGSGIGECVQWGDIAGCEEVKMILMEALLLPPLLPSYFKGIRKPLKGLLLVGPPGTGKTLLAKAVASQCKTTFFNVSSSTLLSKYHGESEKMVRLLFDLARERSPSTIFIDEIDGLCCRRGTNNEHEASRRVKSELLIQMDGILSDGQVIVIGATNFPWDLDDALRRRMQKRVFIGLPNKSSRLKMLGIFTTGISVDMEVDAIAEHLEGYSGADIENVCRDASMMPMRRCFEGLSADQITEMLKESAAVSSDDLNLGLTVTHEDFLSAISKSTPSVAKSDVDKFDAWFKEFGCV